MAQIAQFASRKGVWQGKGRPDEAWRQERQARHSRAQIAQFASRKGGSGQARRSMAQIARGQAGRAGQTKRGPDSPVRVRVEKGGLAGRKGRRDEAWPR